MNNSTGLPRTPVLPPIATASDKAFLASIQTYINQETAKLASADQLDAEQQCTIYGNAFDKVIDYATDYKNILTAIKQEYDEFIDRIKQGQREAAHIQGNLKVLAYEPTTLMHYRKRAKELTDRTDWPGVSTLKANCFQMQEIQLTSRIEIIKNDTCKIETQLQQIYDDKKAKSLQVEEEDPSKRKINPSKLIPEKHGSLSIEVDILPASNMLPEWLVMLDKKANKEPRMTIEDSLSTDALIAYKQQLEAKKQQLMDDMKYKYVPIQKKQELDRKLSYALDEREQTESINKRLLTGYRKRQVIADAISSWAKSDKHTDLYKTLTDVTEKENESKDDPVLTNVFDDYDPRKISEAESLLEYVERFNELFISGDYKAAAVYAANSPKGILRNMETMERFKAVAGKEWHDSPLMVFFEALIGSSYLKKYSVNGALTMEGVKCALSHNKIDLIVHWVNQQRISFSEALGDVISDYGEEKPYQKATCLALAQLIYRKCSSHRKAALCMCLQDQVQGALDYTYQCKYFKLEDYLFLLKNSPTPELIHGLTKEWNGKPAALSVGQAVLSLLCTDHKEYGLQLLESIHKCGDSALEQVILNDVVCTPEGWVEIADECSHNNYSQLSEKIMSIVTSQDGVVEISSLDEDAKIMEHVFM